MVNQMLLIRLQAYYILNEMKNTRPRRQQSTLCWSRFRIKPPSHGYRAQPVATSLTILANDDGQCRSAILDVSEQSRQMRNGRPATSPLKSWQSRGPTLTHLHDQGDRRRRNVLPLHSSWRYTLASAHLHRRKSVQMPTASPHELPRAFSSKQATSLRLPPARAQHGPPTRCPGAVTS